MSVYQHIIFVLTSHLFIRVVPRVASLSAVTSSSALSAILGLLTWLITIIIAHDSLQFLVSTNRPLNDQDAPIDAPSPPEKKYRCEQLEEAHDELSFVCDVLLRHARGKYRATARQHDIESEGNVGDNIVDSGDICQKLEEPHIHVSYC